MDNAQKKNGIEVATEVKSSSFGQDYYHTVRLSYQDLMRSPSYCQQMVEAVFRSIVEKAAEEFLKEHLQAIIADINQEAVATMAMAEAAAQVNKTLKEKIPDKIMRIPSEPEVYQRVLLGGMTRIR